MTKKEADKQRSEILELINQVESVSRDLDRQRRVVNDVADKLYSKYHEIRETVQEDDGFIPEGGL